REASTNKRDWAMPHLSNHEVLMYLLQNIQETTKEPHTLESVNQALQIVRHGHIQLMVLLKDIEDLTKEPPTLERVKAALEILWHPQTQLIDLLLNIQRISKEPHTLASVKEAMPIVFYPQHPVDGFEPYAGDTGYRAIPARKRPTPEERKRCFKSLASNWVEIVGEEIGRVTRPLRLTGKKGGRLVVYADANVRPPWGSWFGFAPPSPSAFTKFRAALNKAVAPHKIDHVDFTTDATRKEWVDKNADLSGGAPEQT